tara:strand:- start:337 stop:1128 length:792 start_codon:yes stop_codon:yes gene_type:complete
MFQIATASFFTWLISYSSTRLVRNTVHDLKDSPWLKLGDNVCRGGVLSFVLVELLPNCINHLGVTTTLYGALFIWTVLAVIETLHKKQVCNIREEEKTKLTYYLLLPHCILEGIAAAKYFTLQHFNIMYIALFLWHKISEMIAIAISTEVHIRNTKQQKLVQQIFILATPCAMLLGTYLQLEAFHSCFTHNIVDLLNMCVLAHIALFCKFCNCDSNKNYKMVQINTQFIAALVSISILLHFFPSGYHAHHHIDHSYHHHHHKH